MADEELPTPDSEPEDSEEEAAAPEEPVTSLMAPGAVARELVNISIEEEMRISYLTYAMSTIISRALPDVRDGLKPVQRRILMAMHDLGLTPAAQRRKSAKIAGDTSGNYHPHGEAVVYPTMVRMAQSFTLRYPLVDGQGNFGSIDGDPPAAMRYTEARMSPFATEMLQDLDRETVEWQENYDQVRLEPTVLPAKFPNFLCNGGTGIAVGMATNVPPHNLREVCDAATHLLENPAATVDDLMTFMKGPDFPTAGMILGTKAIREAFTTGRGSVVMQARTTIEPFCTWNAPCPRPSSDLVLCSFVASESKYAVVSASLDTSLTESFIVAPAG